MPCSLFFQVFTEVLKSEIRVGEDLETNLATDAGLLKYQHLVVKTKGYILPEKKPARRRWWFV